MLSFLFCDDDPFFLRLIRSLSADIIAGYHLPARCIGTVSRPDEALRLCKQNPGPCVIFLDLDFGTGRPGGIDIARQLRQLPGTRIVYVTNHRELAMDVLQSGTEPYGFLEKSTDITALAAGIRKYLSMVLRNLSPPDSPVSPAVIICSGGETYTVLSGDILYLETEKRISHGITYHTIGGSVLTVISTMENELRKLGKGFRRVHRSYIVQNIHVAAMRRGELVLSDGTTIPCSLSMGKEVQAWLAEN
ncbi:MAG: response regulator transcription factor [Clostridia bacterium]|nr:response regulator transcription factor [Clostridia bacterium]